MAVGDSHVLLAWLSHTSTNTLFFSKTPTNFLTCFCKGERRKYARKKVRRNRGSDSQQPGHESDTLSTEPSGQGGLSWECPWTRDFITLA